MLAQQSLHLVMKNIALLFLVIVFSCKVNDSTKVVQKKENTLDELFKSIEKFEASPEDSLYTGHHPRGKWSSISFESQKNKSDGLKKFVASLESISNSTLSTQERISKAVMFIKLNDQIDVVQHKMILIPFDAEGGFYNQMSYVLPGLSFKDTQDYFDYLTWLPRYDLALHENLALMKKGIEEGIVAPKIIVKNNLALLKPWVVDDYTQSAFYTPIANMASTINDADKAAIKLQSEKVISNVMATYKTIYNFFENEYSAAAKDEAGISFVPGGKAYYENRVRHYTTLPLTPDSIHSLGLAEVARIRTAMKKIIEQVNFKGSFADFLSFLRTDEQFFAKTPQELLNYASWLSKKAEGKLPKFFNHLYDLPFTVEPVPTAIAPTYTSGRYVPGSWETKRAGIYWVNTYDLKSRTLYTLPALTLHEAVPGHHLQHALAAEIKDIPAFRNRYYISAFGEGWGLYTEYLGEEMGMYTTPYELFGRYTYEMWRACRLVVDTGIHYKGWTREHALKFLGENTALSLHEVTTEIDRYIGWPGQALSYKVGEIKIKSLRRKSEEVLGKNFSIGAFHNAVLRNGSIPLVSLEGEIDGYIKKELENLK
jgi:uncharacterized protein (DUF885 family)